MYGGPTGVCRCDRAVRGAKIRPGQTSRLPIAQAPVSRRRPSDGLMGAPRDRVALDRAQLCVLRCDEDVITAQRDPVVGDGLDCVEARMMTSGRLRRVPSPRCTNSPPPATARTAGLRELSIARRSTPLAPGSAVTTTVNGQPHEGLT